MAAPWVILRRFLRFVPKEAEAEHAAAVSVALWNPPRVSILDVSPGVHPGPIRSGELPYLVATGPSALLLCFSIGEAPVVTDDLVVARQFVSPGDPSRRQPVTGSAELVPRRTGPSMPVTYDLRSVGLTSGVFGGFVIAELQVTKRSDRAKLLCLFSGDDRWFDRDRLFSSDDQWIEKDLALPHPLSATAKREWSPSGVVHHAKKLWWFDLSWGLLSCDPDAVAPVLRFHNLPPGGYVSEPKRLIHTVRCIGVSGHMLRYVDIAKTKVVMWTWNPDPDGGDGDGGGRRIEWHKTYEMSFKEIWNDTSYRETRLPAVTPEIVLVSPRDPNVVYFFLQRSLFVVDVPAHRVLEVLKDARELLVAPGRRHCVLPWDLPTSIAKGIVEAVVPSEGQSGSSLTNFRRERRRT